MPQKKGKSTLKNGIDYNTEGEHVQVYFAGHDPIQTYLRKNYAKLIIALAFDNEESRSATAKGIIKYFFDNLPEKHIKHLQALYERMSPEERRNHCKRKSNG